MHRLPWIKTPIGRGLLVGVGAALWFLSGVYSLTLLFNTSLLQLDDAALDLANGPGCSTRGSSAARCCSPAQRLSLNGGSKTRRISVGVPDRRIVGAGTVALNCVVLLAGGEKNWPMPPLFLVIAHLPFAVIEGVILGFVVGFLAKVKPEMLATNVRA